MCIVHTSNFFNFGDSNLFRMRDRWETFENYRTTNPLSFLKVSYYSLWFLWISKWVKSDLWTIYVFPNPVTYINGTQCFDVQCNTYVHTDIRSWCAFHISWPRWLIYRWLNNCRHYSNKQRLQWQLLPVVAVASAQAVLPSNFLLSKILLWVPWQQVNSNIL